MQSFVLRSEGIRAGLRFVFSRAGAFSDLDGSRSGRAMRRRQKDGVCALGSSLPSDRPRTAQKSSTVVNTVLLQPYARPFLSRFCSRPQTVMNMRDCKSVSARSKALFRPEKAAGSFRSCRERRRLRRASSNPLGRAADRAAPVGLLQRFAAPPDRVKRDKAARRCSRSCGRTAGVSDVVPFLQHAHPPFPRVGLGVARVPADRRAVGGRFPVPGMTVWKRFAVAAAE